MWHKGVDGARYRDAKRQRWAPGRRLTNKPRRVKMRSLVIAAAMALGLGLAGIQASSAAPVNGNAIHNAAHLNQGTDLVRWHWRQHWGWRHRHWGWRHHHWGW